MKVGRVALLAIGLVAVLVIGGIAGLTMRERSSNVNAPATTVAAPTADPGAPPSGKTGRRVARTKLPSPHVDDVIAAKKAPNTIKTIPVAVWEPELRNRVKGVLSPGSSLEIAAADFDTPEQFITVAHAARNTKVPFMVLKDGLLHRGQSLAETIHQFKPELNAKAEVRRARTAARADLGIAG